MDEDAAGVAVTVAVMVVVGDAVDVARVEATKGANDKIAGSLLLRMAVLSSHTHHSTFRQMFGHAFQKTNISALWSCAELTRGNVKHRRQAFHQLLHRQLMLHLSCLGFLALARREVLVGINRVRTSTAAMSTGGHRQGASQHGPPIKRGAIAQHARKGRNRESDQGG